jgi:hypothetical protein
MFRCNESGIRTAEAHGTGFIWENDGSWYLITNVHNLTGWNCTTNSSLSDMAFTPTNIEFSLGVWALNDEGTRLWYRRAWSLPLSSDDRPNWLVHPVHRGLVDVAALKICAVPNKIALQHLSIEDFATKPVNLHPWDSFDVAVGDDAFVLGFPYNMSGGQFPIWKRASIATEPDVDLEGLPKLLLDTATRQGMSGSPVLHIRRGLTNPSGKFGDDSILGEATGFLGVYSGRIGDDPLGVQLGIVWKGHVIDEIISGGVQGQWHWEQSSS